MLLKEFPDINMVRRLKNDAVDGYSEWRNVVLNFECREASRLNLESPYSLFINKKGHSHCTVNNRPYLVETDNFLFSQPGDIYGLTVDNMQKTELCNIHINKHFFNDVARTLTTPNDQLLDNPDNGNDQIVPVLSHLYKKDKTIDLLSTKLTNPDTYIENAFEDVLTTLVEHLLIQNEQIKSTIRKLPFMKTSVKIEIYNRLAAAKDYIYSNYNIAVNLDDICRETNMSKFHFLRLFKSLYGMTPYQFLSDIRMKKALILLKSTSCSIAEISDALGYDYPNSFNKAFQKAYQTSPLQFRKHEISNFG